MSDRINLNELTPEALLSERQILVNLIYPRSHAQLWRDVKSGLFPKPDVRIGTRCTRWRARTLLTWLQQQSVGG